MSKFVLTQKQKSVLEFLETYLDKNRHAPFIREIQDGCEIVSYKSVIDRLNALERKGYIKRLPNKHRGIKILKKAPGAEESTPGVHTYQSAPAAEPVQQEGVPTDSGVSHP